MTLFALLLWIHIVSAVVAFGPPLVLGPLAGSMLGKEPMHANFIMRLTKRLLERVTLPVAYSMPVTGVLMVWAGGLNLFKPWLIVSIALYIALLGVATGVQVPSVKRFIELTSAPPPPPAPGAPPGPPPAIAALRDKMKRTGHILTVIFLAITLLMVWRPA